METQRDINTRALDEMSQIHGGSQVINAKKYYIFVFCNIDHSQRDLIQYYSKLLLQIPLTFYLTSIYDHSIFEAFSKVVQKLIPQVGNFY